MSGQDAPIPRILIVAGSDSGGGAGIQADIKTVTALGGFAMTAVTALTAQNTEGVAAVFDVPPAFAAQQMRVVLDDIGADALKTGMLHHAGVIEAVAAVIDEKAGDIPLVVDPVMVAQSGASLLDPEAVDALKQHLLPRAAVLTPNIPEAETLIGAPIATVEDMVDAAEQITAMGPSAVLLKGGHMAGETLTDVLRADGLVETFADARIDTPHTHGTGCTLASAIATGLGQGLSLRDAVVRGRNYLREAIRTAPGFGHGHGPVNHGHPLVSSPGDPAT